ncbi:nucleotide exchange factor GrpE [Alphaproteobacteria bacterium]|jgi:molecular chaperone GrpE|nr:nucleotide exchange factor GrpE [Alphaproteobacteria bacterium]MDB0027640.1 nucleotide exchange factor GrpE [Alphaproteobacteria bacterium]
MTQENDTNQPAEDIPAENIVESETQAENSPELTTAPVDGEDNSLPAYDAGGDDDIANLAAERDELRDQLLRTLADNENLRRRTERELTAAKKYGAMGFARDLMASVDNLDKAIDLIPENKDELGETVKNILIGVEMTGREIASVLERHNISKISPDGEKFDYNLHQAMFEVPSDDVEPGIVMQVVQSGYQLHDRLLRPAMVGVSKPASPPQTTEAPETES